MESPAICSTGIPAGDGSSKTEREGLISTVDPFLVEALQNPRHRLTVLRMELDIQRFMQNCDQQQFEFQQLPTSYLRCAAHRVAQHYGLQTVSLGSIIDGLGSRVIARKTADSSFPAIVLSKIPANQTDKGSSECVKIAIRPRPSRTSASGTAELGIKKSHVRTVEEREEEYDKARARIFSNSSTVDIERMCSSGEEKKCNRIFSESEITSTKDGVSRVAIFRDTDKDCSDPDYDRTYERYVSGLRPSQNLGLGPCNILRPLLPQNEAGSPQFGQMSSNQNLVSYRIPQMAPNRFYIVGSNHTFSNDAAFHMKCPGPATVFAHS